LLNVLLQLANKNVIKKSFVIRCIATDCCVWTDLLKTPLVKRYGIVVLVRYQGSETSKPLHSNGHLSIVAHVGGSQTGISLAFPFSSVFFFLPFRATFCVSDLNLPPSSSLLLFVEGLFHSDVSVEEL
jgi:hypothetical protein